MIFFNYELRIQDYAYAVPKAFGVAFLKLAQASACACLLSLLLME